ncbi:MAG: zinc-dependent metalloprotease [Planctomycetaceae bacterium]|nr:zinc-dependent metalloprotease [Planctomycetales bacterium]MCB9927522.1 zinc-dependent metalloprotease [Planctomycetaceae bacterium]
MNPSPLRKLLLGLCVGLTFATYALADDTAPSSDESANPKAVEAATSSSSEASSSSSTAAKAPAPAHVAILKDAKTHTGMLTLYQKESKLYAEMSGSDYGAEYIVLISIAKGVGMNPLLGGYSWGFGDDWVWTFRKVDDHVHVIRKNVRFEAKKGYPENFALQNAYTDSVLFSLRIVSKGPKGGDLVDMTPVFMSDLPQISQFLPGFGFTSDRSTWAAVKAFPKNIELEVAATYASSGRLEYETVADSRGMTINVHYSISKLSSTGYQSRMADDRIGYFLTVRKDYNKDSDRDQFVRYINRWHLEKPPGATDAPYPPKEPIIFWIEKTVPHKYRQPVREGIAEWNKAFEKAGWLNAIEVRQQPDDADWDPEDINYNTFRWITADAGFAMGPSRVNPYTGQILDADIIFDADFLKFWKEEFETLSPDDVAAMTGGALNAPADTSSRALGVARKHPECRLSNGMASQMAFGTTAILAHAADPKVAAEMKEKLIMQGMKEVTMHEVGHTLGLRHNFKASKMLSLKDANDTKKTRDVGMVGSVMDYNPSNIVSKEWEQGDYYTTTLGPYDYWAIEYGYKPLSGGTTGEVKELEKIAARSGEPQLAYATDEDTVGSDPDPNSNRFDLGSDALEYAKMRAQVVQEIIPELTKRTAEEGDDYTQTRRALNILLSQHGQGMFFVARYVGGLNTSRSHQGDKDAKPPIDLIDAKLQREALSLLEEQVFSDKPYQFPDDLFKYLAASNWNHWGTSNTNRKDFPLHDVISMWQTRVLDQLTSSTVLERIHDIELKAATDADVLTTAELIERLTKSIFSELDTVKEGDFTNRKPAISSLRRNLQREYLRTLANLAMGRTSAPDDCQTIAYADLSSLEARIGQMLKSNVKLDSYSRAHLVESASRIRKVLDADLSLYSP